MTAALIILAAASGVIVVAIVGYIVSYNRLIDDRNTVETSWATVDTELQRRHELVPSLVEAVRGYAAHDQDLLVRAAGAHARATAGEHTPAAAARHEPAVAAAAADLVRLGERYPQLDAQQNFLDLQVRLTMTEDRIAAARRSHNTVVAKLNWRIEAFPSNIVARWGGVGPADYFER